MLLHGLGTPAQVLLHVCATSHPAAAPCRRLASAQPASLSHPACMCRTPHCPPPHLPAADGYAAELGDGRGVTFGRAGFTSGTSDGLLVVRRYADVAPANNTLARYLPVLRRLAVTAVRPAAGSQGSSPRQQRPLPLPGGAAGGSRRAPCVRGKSPSCAAVDCVAPPLPGAAPGCARRMGQTSPLWRKRRWEVGGGNHLTSPHHSGCVRPTPPARPLAACPAGSWRRSCRPGCRGRHARSRPPSLLHQLQTTWFAPRCPARSASWVLPSTGRASCPRRWRRGGRRRCVCPEKGAAGWGGGGSPDPSPRFAQPVAPLLTASAALLPVCKLARPRAESPTAPSTLCSIPPPPPPPTHPPTPPHTTTTTHPPTHPHPPTHHHHHHPPTQPHPTPSHRS